MEGAELREYKEVPGACAACGNSPVNHFQTYVAYTMSAWGSRARGSWNPLQLLRMLSGALADRIEPYVHRAVALMPFSRFSRDIGKAATYRSQVVWEEAQRRGITMEQLVVAGAYTDIYRARVKGRTLYFQSLPTASFQRTNDGWIDDKILLKRALYAAGCKAPRAVSAVSFRDAREALEELGAPVTVKPQVGSRGRHTTTGVREVGELEKAFNSAKKLCRYVSIEEHLEGPVCRATLVGGKLAGFFEALPPRVTGDGVSTIEELVARKNAGRPARVGAIELTSEHRAYLSRLGLASGSVLPKGKTVALTHRTGRLFGGETRELFGAEHPRLRAELERAAAALGIPIVGFDLIIEDPERDPAQQHWGIIEANSLPYIDLHYLPLRGEPTNVAATVWDWVEHNL